MEVNDDRIKFYDDDIVTVHLDEYVHEIHGRSIKIAFFLPRVYITEKDPETKLTKHYESEKKYAFLEYTLSEDGFEFRKLSTRSSKNTEIVSRKTKD